MGKLNNTTGRLYHDYDFMSPTTTAIGIIMYSPLHMRTYFKNIDQRTLHLFRWHFHHTLLFLQQLLVLQPYQPKRTKRKVHIYCAHRFPKSWQPWRVKSLETHKNNSDAISDTSTLRHEVCQNANDDHSYICTGHPWQQSHMIVRSHK